MYTALWTRLAAHPLEDLLLRKLAREHGWSERFARSAIEEYRRFCYLACTRGAPATPSDAVDEVWHLHLTFSRDYWERFCREVLGAPLHHEPARAGEDLRHREQYADTLLAYERAFGPPPESIWPSTVEQFRAPARFRRVDLERVIVLPRPRLRVRARALLAALGLAASPIATAAQEWNPLDWNGPQFLVFYLALLVAAIVGAVFWRRALLGGGARNAAHLGTYEIAYLDGGAARVVDAGVAELLASGKARWDAATRRIVVTADPRSLAHPLDQIAQTLADTGTAAKAVERVGPQLESTRRALVSRGLLPDPADALRAQRRSALLLALVVLVGVAKIAIGVSRDKPVALLGQLVFVAAIAAVVFLNKQPRRTAAGSAALADLRRKHARAARAPTGAELPLAVALVGTSVLAGTAYAAYHDVRQSSGGSSGSSCSSGDSGSGCSGGGGCGGCGGGGGD